MQMRYRLVLIATTYLSVGDQGMAKTVFMFSMLLACVAPVGASGCNQQSPSSQKPIPEHYDWIRAGAKFGSLKAGEAGLSFTTRQILEPGEMFGFKIGRIDGKQLPDPGVPFGLIIWPPDSAVIDSDFQKKLISGEDVRPKTDLKDLATLKSLTILELRSVQITDAGMKELAALKSLESLFLNDTKVSSNGLNELANQQALRLLYLNGTKVSSEGLRAIGSLSSLKSLGLFRAGVTDKGLKELASLTSLHSLDLPALRISDEGFKELAKLKNIKRLNLYLTKISDDGIKELSSLQNLVELNLCDTGVTDKAVKNLALIKSLQSLDLSKTEVSSKGLAELRLALPNCKIQTMTQEP